MIPEQFTADALVETARIPWPMLADVSPAGAAIEAGRPVVTIFAEGATDDEVEQRLRKRVADAERIIYAV